MNEKYENIAHVSFIKVYNEVVNEKIYSVNSFASK